VQTLLVTFIADTAQERYVFRYGDGVAPGPLQRMPVTATREGDVVIVNTGVLRAKLGGEGSGFVRELSYDANGDGRYSADETVVAEGKPGVLRCGEFSSAFGKPERIEIEEGGPIRAVVRLCGHHQSKTGKKSIAYDVRLTFYAGLSLVRVDHTFVQDTGQVFADLPFVSVDLPLAMGQGSVTFGADGDKEVVCGAGGPARLVQVGPGWKETISGLESEEFRRIVDERKRYWSADEETRWTKGPAIMEWSATVSDKAGPRKVGERASGWVRVTPQGKPWAITAGVRYFWQLHPKAFLFEGNALRIFAYPDALDKPLHLHIGTAKTHTIFLYVHDAKDVAGATATTKAFFEPPMYFPAPEWYCDSGVWGQIFPRREGQFRLYETEAARTIHDDFVERPERSNWYGMLNFGDLGNMNLETAYDHGMAVQFVRTGDREVFDSFERAVWHFRDVDVQQAKAVSEWDWGLWLIPGYMPEKLAQECAKDFLLDRHAAAGDRRGPPALVSALRQRGVHPGAFVHEVPGETAAHVLWKL
jgi:hypothetical protein